MTPAASSPARRVALVTGAAGIIGPALCAALQGGGWIVAAADRSEAAFALAARLNGAAVAADLRIGADLTEHAECGRLVQRVRDAFGRLDLLVNNATGNVQALPLDRLAPEVAERLVQVDLLAPLYLSQAARPALSAARGLIINMSSVRACHPAPGTTLYSAVKAGLEALTRALAVELMSDGIRVNGIRIGAVPGDAFLREFLETLAPEVAQRLRRDVMAAHYAAAAAAIPVGSAGTPQDIANMVAYLASPQGSFINGAVIPVDGAFAAVEDHRVRTGIGGGSPWPQRWRENPAGEFAAWSARQGEA